MKTILKILVILLMAGIIAGGLYALVENSSLVSDGEFGSSEPSVRMDDDESALPAMERPGEEQSASWLRGLPELFMTLVKLAIITVLALFVQKGLRLIAHRRLNPFTRQEGRHDDAQI